jgi:EAL domain-containing protein (putative c-di-GMP-specific phosphodiesterase class I)
MARDLSKRDDFFISLNVSQTQLDDPAFSESLRQNMADASFPLANLVVEVTEDFTPIEPGRMTAFSAGLGSADTRFALDDFGRGNWSLDHLWRLPFSILKLDRRLIANIVKSRNDRDLLEDLLARAGEHKLRTIAEGVETAEQVDLLTQMGVDGLQGFQLSTPRSAAESLDLITASAA